MDPYLTETFGPLPSAPRIIGLYSPQAGSGESVVASALQSAGYELVKFAGPLKEMARGLFRTLGIDGETIERMVEGDLKEAPIPGLSAATPRKVMQTLGTDWGREAIERDLWINAAKAKIERSLAAGRCVVIDDMRFPNELAFMRTMGALTVRIERPDPSRPGMNRYEGNLEGCYFRAEIRNDGTLEDLRNKAFSLLSIVPGQGR